MKYPYKYFFDKQKLVWEKKFFFQKETKTIEIDFKDIEHIRFMPASWICDVYSMEVYSKNKKIHVFPRLVNWLPNSEFVFEHETTICTVLERTRNNKNAKYSKGHLGGLIAIAILCIFVLPAAFFSWQLVFSYLNQGDFMHSIPTLFTAIGSILYILLSPLFILRLIPKRINPEHILKYSPKVLFNRRYRKFIYEETGVKID